MLKQISWGEYWTAILVVAIVYYMVIALVFYRKSISLLLKRFAHLTNSPSNYKDITHDPEEQENQVR